MGKNGSVHASETGSDSTGPTPNGCDKGFLELDPTTRYMRV